MAMTNLLVPYLSFLFQIYDIYGSYFTICGFRNDTKADTVESRFNYLYIRLISNEIISADGFNFSYRLIAREGK